MFERARTTEVLMGIIQGDDVRIEVREEVPEPQELETVTRLTPQFSGDGGRHFLAF